LKEPDNDSIKEFNYLLIKQIQKGLNYIYRGPFTVKINEDIISLFESSLNDHESQKQTKKKVYSMMVEGLQYATNHQVGNIVSKQNNDGVFILKKAEHNYYIITGNLVSNEEKESIIEKISQINYPNQNKSASQYKPILEESLPVLSILEMARKKGNRFQYSFKNVDQELSYFYLSVEISANQYDQIEPESNNTDQLDFLPDLHQSLNKENILILFNALLNQESIINLIAFVEKQINESILIKKRLYGAMIEMIQNIIQHGSKNKNEENLSESLFYISQKNDCYLLHSGNYIENWKVMELSVIIESINSMDLDELEEYYNEKLFDFDNENGIGAGLGICDIRLKSGNKLAYLFLPIDDDYSFFHFKVTISTV